MAGTPSGHLRVTTRGERVPARPTSRPSSIAVLVVALLLMLTGCGGPSRQVDALPGDFVESPTLSAAVQAHYGDSAITAYREITMFSLHQWLQPDLLDPSNTGAVTAANLSDGIVGRLTAATRPHWAGLVDGALKGDAASREDVALLRFHDWQAPTLTLPTGSPVNSQAISGAKISLGTAYSDGTVPLVIAFQQRARITLINKRAPYPATIDKAITFHLVPAASSAGTTAPTAASAGSAGSARSTASAPAVSATTDPSATWLISAFEGTLEVDFDKSETDSTMAPSAGAPAGPSSSSSDAAARSSSTTSG